jgi:hypothetical protein
MTKLKIRDRTYPFSLKPADEVRKCLWFFIQNMCEPSGIYLQQTITISINFFREKILTKLN